MTPRGAEVVALLRDAVAANHPASPGFLALVLQVLERALAENELINTALHAHAAETVKLMQFHLAFKAWLYAGMPEGESEELSALCAAADALDCDTPARPEVAGQTE